MRSGQQGVTLGELILVLTALVFLSAFIFPQIYLIRQRVENDRCASNLKKIGVGLHVYANEESDLGFPKDDTAREAFSRIFVNGNITDISVFDCPVHPGHPAGNPGKHLRTPSSDLENAGFLYNKEDLTLNSPSSAVIAMDKPGSHGGSKIHVLYVNGSVNEIKTVPPGDFA